jgi:hypothetical protein
MDSSKLRPWQCRKIIASLQRMTGYLSRLKRRMELTGPNDPLYLLTVQAQRDMQTLLVELHYLSCESGVARSPSRGDDKPPSR